MSDDLAALLARTPPQRLLPARRAEEAARIERPWTVLARASLGVGLAYLLLRDARGITYGVPVHEGPDGLRRAVAGDGAAEALVTGLRSGLAAPLTAEVLHCETATGERELPVDQTNDLVVVGESAVVKWLLHPVAGDPPGAVRARQLRDVRHVPRPWALVYAEAGGEQVLVATVASAVPDAEDGWDWAVRDVRDHARRPGPSDAALTCPARLGPILARIHLALAAAGSSSATAADARTWHAWALRDLADAGLDEEVAARVRAAVAPLADCAGTPVIPIHGDLHVGQVLRTRDSEDLHVIDFDGNPLLTAQENLSPQPAARDVAGMLASWDHVGRVVLHRTDDLDARQRDRVLAWIPAARAAFLDGYREELRRAGRPELLDERLLRPMLVQQECREYAYARRYLPHWRYVPDAALPALLEEDVDEA